MGTVDIGDDERSRFVVQRYTYDPERRERRHVVVAVVDNKREFERLFNQHAEELERRRAAGDDVDPREHISGHVMEPGHLARAANGRLISRAIKHGVWPAELASLELPGGMALMTAECDQQE